MHSDDVYDFGFRLRNLRKNKKMSQNDIAEKLEVNKATISAYERNVTTPSVDTIVKLAIIYGASVDYILGLTDRTELYLDDLSPNQKSFILDVLAQIREKFEDKKADD